MTVAEAYRIISIENPVMKVRACLDFGTFFAFNLAPLDVDNDEDYESGTCLLAVDKNSKQTFIYDITEDVDAYYNAKKVEVGTIFDVKISDIKSAIDKGGESK